MQSTLICAPGLGPLSLLAPWRSLASLLLQLRVASPLDPAGRPPTEGADPSMEAHHHSLPLSPPQGCVITLRPPAGVVILLTSRALPVHSLPCFLSCTAQTNDVPLLGLSPRPCRRSLFSSATTNKYPFLPSASSAKRILSFVIYSRLLLLLGPLRVVVIPRFLWLQSVLLV